MVLGEDRRISIDVGEESTEAYKLSQKTDALHDIEMNRSRIDILPDVITTYAHC